MHVASLPSIEIPAASLLIAVYLGRGLSAFGAVKNTDIPMLAAKTKANKVAMRIGVSTLLRLPLELLCQKFESFLSL